MKKNILFFLSFLALAGCSKDTGLTKNQWAVYKAVFVNKSGKPIEKVAIRFVVPGGNADSASLANLVAADSIIGGPILPNDSLILKYNLKNILIGKETYPFTYVWFNHLETPSFRTETPAILDSRKSYNDVRWVVYADSLRGFGIPKKKKP